MKTTKNSYSTSAAVTRNKVALNDEHTVRNQRLCRHQKKEEQKPDIFQLNQCFDNFFTKIIH
jgi:hypothetical protein